MPFIGNTPQTQSFAPAIDYFSGNGVTVTFTLSRPVVSVAQLTVAIDNVIQNPSSAFTVSGNSITFTSAPLSGTNNIWVEYTSLITTYAAISQDPSVIGDITATGGFLAEGDFGNSYIDGTIVDYVTGNARITTGPIDDMTFYHGGTSGRSEMMRLSYAGNSYIIGNLGVGAAPSSEWAAGQFAQVTGTSTYSVASLATTRTVADGNRIGSLTWEMPNNTATYRTRAVIEACMSGSTANKYGAFLVFSTATDNTQNPTERMRIDSSGNVGIGTSSPSGRLDVLGSVASTSNWGNVNITSRNAINAANRIYTALRLQDSGSGDAGAIGYSYDGTGYNMMFATVPTVGGAITERMRINSAGRVLIGTTSFGGDGVSISGTQGDNFLILKTNSTGTYNQALFANPNGNVGYIQTSGSSCAYVNASDYRLKENIAPMTGALAKVQQLKPCTYTWKVDGSAGQGFIAHELQEVVPEAVMGEKDAVNEDGTINPQGVDPRFLVATLTAAIQELKAEVDSLKAQLEAK